MGECEYQQDRKFVLAFSVRQGCGHKGAREMFIYTGEGYRNLDLALEIRTEVSGTRCKVFVRYPDLKEPISITGPQAHGALEYVLRRRVASTNDALDAIFQRIEEVEDLSHGNGNGNKPVKTRKPRILRHPEYTSRLSSIKAHMRWSGRRGDLQEFETWKAQLDKHLATKPT